MTEYAPTIAKGIGTVVIGAGLTAPLWRSYTGLPSGPAWAFAAACLLAALYLGYAFLQ